MSINRKGGIKEFFSIIHILFCSKIDEVAVGDCVHSFVVAVPVGGGGGGGEKGGGWEWEWWWLKEGI